MKMLNEDLVEVKIQKSKNETVVTANVGRLVWAAFLALIAMVLFVKR